MVIKGKPKSLEESLKILKADYKYSNEELEYCTAAAHLFVTYIEVDACDIDVLSGRLALCGDCRWSVAVCMLGNGYYHAHSEKQGFIGTSLQEISKKFDVEIEVFSREYGLEFEEHYQIKHGNLIVEEVVDFREVYNEKNESYTTTGGFGSWVFSI